MMNSDLYQGLLLSVWIVGTAVMIILLIIDAPYGRHSAEGWGPTIPTRIGWILMESPSSIGFFYFFITGMINRTDVEQVAAHPISSWPQFCLMVMWQLHYIHRAFIYPFTMATRPNDRMPIIIMLSGSLFCSVNSSLNGTAVSTFSHLQSDDWLSDPRFIVGCFIFIVGFIINKQSDAILRSLRLKSSSSIAAATASASHYQIPYGGMYSRLSCPNYFGELLTWLGFALAAWTPAAASFVFFTLANLLPRALANHRWYLKTFGDKYPRDRKAMIPFVV